MPADVLFSHISRVIGDKANNFIEPLAKAIANYSESKAKLSRSASDRKAKEMFEHSDNPQVVAIREKRDAAKKALEEANNLAKQAIDAIKVKLAPDVSDDEKKELRAARKKARDEVSDSLDALNTLATRLFDDADLANAIEDFRKEFGQRKASSGSGGVKPRVQQVRITHPSGQVVEEKNFSKAALRTKLNAQLLQESWYQAAGTDDWKQINSPVSFEQGEFTVTVTPLPPKPEKVEATAA